MNSDPYDSAVWRSFGMLDADESAIFDEAARIDPLLRGALLEQDRLSAAIAVATSTPVTPKAGQLERLEARLGLHKTRRGPWIAAISGWAAAAALAAMWLLDHHGMIRFTDGSSKLAGQSVSPPDASKNLPLPAASKSAAENSVRETPAPGDSAAATAAVDENMIKSRVRAETKRLVQEIEVLRDNLEKFQNRDRVLFEPVPGMALPIVMTMNPPGAASENEEFAVAGADHSPIQALLGGEERTVSGDSKVLANPGVTAAETPPAPSPAPSAIPIYDPARDSGTIVVSNLPPAEQGKVYNLWVRTLNADRPIFVGSLPAGNSTGGAESFDFNLGTNMTLPSGFMLTKDPANQPASPSAANTILQGPPTPGR